MNENRYKIGSENYKAKVKYYMQSNSLITISNYFISFSDGVFGICHFDVPFFSFNIQRRIIGFFFSFSGNSKYSLHIRDLSSESAGPIILSPYTTYQYNFSCKYIYIYEREIVIHAYCFSTSNSSHLMRRV